MRHITMPMRIQSGFEYGPTTPYFLFSISIRDYMQFTWKLCKQNRIKKIVYVYINELILNSWNFRLYIYVYDTSRIPQRLLITILFCYELVMPFTKMKSSNQVVCFRALSNVKSLILFRVCLCGSITKKQLADRELENIFLCHLININKMRVVFLS